MTKLCNRVLIAASIILASFTTQAAFAQQKLKGTYVFSEEGLAGAGQQVAALGSLTFDEGGTVIGTELAQSGPGVASYAVQGTYAFDADGTGNLVLTVSATDSEGNPSGVNQNYKLIVPQSGDIVAVRVNPGFYTTAKLDPSVSGAVRGTYILNEKATNRPFARVALITFDGAGSASGFQLSESTLGSTRASLKGAQTAKAEGFQSLDLAAEWVDANGDTQTAREGYVFMATRDELRSLRVDDGLVSLATWTH